MVHLPLPRKAGKSVADIAQVAPRSGEDARRAAGRRCRRGIAHEGEVALQQGKPAHDVIDDGDGAAALTKGRAAKDGKGLGHGTLLTVFFVGACRTQKGSGCRKLPSDSGHIPPKGLVLAHTRSRRLRKDAPQRSQDGSRAQKIHEVTVAEAADG